MPGGRREDNIEPADVVEQTGEWLIDDELDPDGGGEVKASVDRLHELVDELLARRRSLDELSLPGGEQVLDVLAGPRAQVVQDDDLVAAGSQGVSEVGADEAGAAGDEVSHGDE